MKGAIIVAAAICVAAFSVEAQQDETASRARALAEASRLGSSGDVLGARRITDSLAKLNANAADFADILFARATFAPTMLDASLDYEKIISESPQTAAAKASLLRLAQRALISSEQGKALDYLQRVLRDFPDDSSTAEAQYWRTRALLESRDVAAACAANREALTHAQASRSSLLPSIEALSPASCGGSPIVQAAATTLPKPVPTGGTRTSGTATGAPPKTTVSTDKTYAVQVAAFPTRKDAEGLADRLKEKGLDAHVDGTVKPFRVRIGRYHSYADAARALRDLKTKKLSGFVAETNE